MDEPSNTSNSNSLFTDDSPEMRKELNDSLAASVPQMSAKPSEEFQKYFEFIPRIMDILGFEEEQKAKKLNEFYFGIEAIALDRIVEMMEPEARAKFEKLFETTDPANATPEQLTQFQNDLKANTDNQKIFQAYFSAVSAMVELTTQELYEQANETQKQEIKKILLEQQDKMSNMTVKVAEKSEINSLNS